MNSVLSTNCNKPLLPHQPEEDTRVNVLLFTCVLFISALFLLSLFSNSPSPAYTLQITPANGLILTLEQAPDMVSTAGEKLNHDTFDLSPFFFLPVPINFCDSTLLMTVRGIGPALAAKIIATREKYGFFTNPEDLKNVPGIGNIRLTNLADQFSFTREDLEGH